ncbi:MAG TPA: alkaline phosphatase D family protein [Actinomycetota bacterium]|nr:alkaline phosphatase D family protein [Actinomycetota bacterium]
MAGGSVLAASLVGCDPAEAPPATNGASGGVFTESFTRDSATEWPSDWLNVRYQSRMTVSNGRGVLAAEQVVPKAVQEGKDLPKYMSQPVIVPSIEAADGVAIVHVEAAGPCEAGVICRTSYDEAYALLVSGDEVLLCRYDVADRAVLDSAPLPGASNGTALRLSATGGTIEGTATVGGEEVTLSFNDPNPLEAGHPGVLINPLSATEGAEARFKDFSFGPGDRSGSSPRWAYAFSGAVISEGADSFKARLAARTIISQPLAFEIARDKAFTDARLIDGEAPTADLGGVRAWAPKLKGGTTYWWRPVAEDGTAGTASSFRTPPSPGEPVRFVFASCTPGRVTEYPSFDVARELDPDFYMHAGDWGYADLTCHVRRADHFHSRWLRMLRVTPVATLLRDTPLLFWQDDHDYQADNGWSGTVQQYAVDAFDELHANPTDEYFDIRWGDVHIWCLDCRLYASDPEGPDDATKTRIGFEQKQWLMDGMTASDAPVRIVGSAMVFRNKPDDDPGWHNDYTYERDELLDFFSSLDATVAILSGDSHGQRLIHHHEFGELYEFNCSGTDFPGGDQGNNDPDHTLANLTDSGFALVELDPAGPDRVLTVSSIATDGGRTLFSKSLPVSSG